MASIVGRLARTLSSGAEEASHRRSSSSSDGCGGGILSPRPVGTPRISTSPSFNDFSLNAQEDAEEEYRSLFADMADAKTICDNGIDQSNTTRCENSTAGAQPVGAVPPKAVPTARATLKSRARSVKVMGMDAYDYCDLLRSSSL
ncbi:unnamed protein product [Ostreobium quekettii]|uniref:Uncharacterized protein n=1 Tax=Ostreobium quekettii TaxID=121088 RepID=A0A8S1IW33_9CHLO|nr:unnamed protein product [Ostreobium quekettii]|eukprot:evm.model.scf_2882.2 EVM.evm.TU.scf_2882.2   scf_2882:15092-16705(+)